MRLSTLPAKRWLLVGAALVLTAVVVGLSLGSQPSSPAPGKDCPEGTCVRESPGPFSIESARRRPAPRPRGALEAPYAPRKEVMDTGGFGTVRTKAPLWDHQSSLEQVRIIYERIPRRLLDELTATLKSARSPAVIASALDMKASVLNYVGDPEAAYQNLERAREVVEADPALAAAELFPIIYFQGITALRGGENDNCVNGSCREACSCIVPFDPAAVHKRPEGSRLAVHHFMEYLAQFPDDLGVRWLLNVAHMTLGEHPAQVDPRFLITLEHFEKSEFDIGRFRDVGHAVGIHRLNEAGGAILEDLDGDGLLDLALSSFDASQPMAIFRNRGDGTFEDRSEASGVRDQLGGLNCVQTDYDNDGHADIFVVRGAWLRSPIRTSLLRNDGTGKFEDVTERAGLLDPVNSNSAQWADYDNDGWLDLFIACENQPNRLYRNRGDGTFEERALAAGLTGNGGYYKGTTWIDLDNDRFPDLFLNDLNGTARLFHNRGDGTFLDASTSLGIDGPTVGFSCWTWDFDNDGWLDIFATSYEHTLADVVRGLIGQPRQGPHGSRLFRNLGGQGFKDVSQEAGLDAVYATMGSNFADFDNDGYLDMYLGTGDPMLSSLVPNRMFKNVGGRRFSEITASAGTGHLQKGHGVACGDWDRDGDVDLFVETGGAVLGDRFHNALFQNPGQGNRSLTVRLVGKRSNRAAIGARIKVVTGAELPLTIHRHVTSGSSFGANPLEQTIGLGAADRVTTLEVYWPTSDTTQVFHDIAAGQVIRITEFATSYEALPRPRLPQPR